MTKSRIYYTGQTYAGADVERDMKVMKPILESAKDLIHRPDLRDTIFKDYYIPYCWWLEEGWLYVRWHMINGEDDKPTVRYRDDGNGELTYEIVEQDAIGCD